jgi:flagellar hook-associated protein 2
VVAYNDFNDTMTILLDRQSEVEQYGGALAGDSLAASIRTRIRALITDDSTTPGTDIEAARDVGISFDRDGKMTLDETTLDEALSDSLADVVTMFTADSDDKSLYSSADAGLAGDLVREIDEMLRYSGLLREQTDNITTKMDAYKADLEKLEERMQKLLTMYTQQFSVMESVVGSTNSMRTSLTSSFEGMMNAYKN